MCSNPTTTAATVTATATTTANGNAKDAKHHPCNNYTKTSTSLCSNSYTEDGARATTMTSRKTLLASFLCNDIVAKEVLGAKPTTGLH